MAEARSSPIGNQLGKLIRIGVEFLVVLILFSFSIFVRESDQPLDSFTLTYVQVLIDVKLLECRYSTNSC